MEVVLLPIYNSVSIYLDGVMDRVNCLRRWAEDEVRSNVDSGCVNYKSVGGDAWSNSLPNHYYGYWPVANQGKSSNLQMEKEAPGMEFPISLKALTRNLYIIPQRMLSRIDLNKICQSPGFEQSLYAIASPSSYPCQSVCGWVPGSVILSFRFSIFISHGWRISGVCPWHVLGVSVRCLRPPSEGGVSQSAAWLLAWLLHRRSEWRSPSCLLAGRTSPPSSPGLAWNSGNKFSWLIWHWKALHIKEKWKRGILWWTYVHRWALE